MGGRRREGGKQDSQNGGNREKLRKILQHFLIFCNRNGPMKREPGVIGTGSRRFRPPGLLKCIICQVYMHQN